MLPSRRSPADIEMDQKNARRHGRVRCESVPSSIGPLMDLSASGCRVFLKGKPTFRTDDILRVRVQGADGPFELEGKVVWVRKTGWFKHEAGLEFTNVTGVIRQQLANLARLALITESLRWDEKKAS
jgi:hypothetical protein